jgi:hypothetical protein
MNAWIIIAVIVGAALFAFLCEFGEGGSEYEQTGDE